MLMLYSITGDILEYHFLRQHATFGSHRSFMTDIRNNIEQNLRQWDRTLKDHLARCQTHQISEQDDGVIERRDHRSSDYDSESLDSTNSKVVFYGRHIWHCLHVLLFGTMDFVEMYRDLAWQASTDFVQAGEHAISCAKVSFTLLCLSAIHKQQLTPTSSQARSSSWIRSSITCIAILEPISCNHPSYFSSWPRNWAKQQIT